MHTNKAVILPNRLVRKVIYYHNRPKLNSTIRSFEDGFKLQGENRMVN